MRCVHASLVLSLALAAAPIAAQRMGSVNRNAPTAGCFIEFAGGNRLDVSYQAITLAQGRFMSRLQELRKQDDKEQVEGFVERFNVRAKDEPLGKLKVTGKITLGKTEVAAGEYRLAFMLDEEVHWKVVILDTEQKAKASWSLDTKAPKATARRLSMWLVAGDQGGADLGIAFGDVASKLTVTTGPGKGVDDRPARGASGRRGERRRR